MELRQIQYFICLFEEGSVTRAARRLNIVQPALSMQIARLERDLGQRLFERTRQGMTPTAAARRMYRLFLPIMRDLSHAREQMAAAAGEISGHVNIGLVASVTEGVLAETLSAFSERHPRVGVTVSEGYTATLTERVSGGQLDAAIINKPRRTLSLNVEHIVDEDLVLVTAARHADLIPPRLALKHIPSLALPLVLPSRQHGLRAVLESFAQLEDVDLAPTFEIDSLATSVKLVERTRLATILPRIAVHERLSEGALCAHPFVSPRLIRQLVSISHPRRPLSPATGAFISVLTEQIRMRAGEQTHEQTADSGSGTAPA